MIILSSFSNFNSAPKARSIECSVWYPFFISLEWFGSISLVSASDDTISSSLSLSSVSTYNLDLSSKLFSASNSKSIVVNSLSDSFTLIVCSSWFVGISFDTACSSCCRKLSNSVLSASVVVDGNVSVSF